MTWNTKASTFIRRIEGEGNKIRDLYLTTKIQNLHNPKSTASTSTMQTFQPKNWDNFSNKEEADQGKDESGSDLKQTYNIYYIKPYTNYHLLSHTQTLTEKEKGSHSDTKMDLNPIQRTGNGEKKKKKKEGMNKT